MKVVQILPALEQGGVERVVCALNRMVCEAGWQSVVISCGGRLVAEVEQCGGRHVALDVKGKNPLTYFSRARALRRVLRAEKPDLVCVHSRVPAWLFVWANRPLGLRWFTYAHGANSVSRYSAVMTKGDLTVVPSHFLADYLKAHYPIDDAKIRVIHPPVDTQRFDPARVDARLVAERRQAWGLTPDDFVVMTVGRLTPIKGYDWLIRDMAQLIAHGLRTKLVIVGDADARHQAYAASLRALVHELGIASSVVFAGGETHVPECLALAHVVVSANTRKPESFGLSMAEALAMNKPVVAKAFGGACDIVRDGQDGLLVQGESFADALLAVRDRDFTSLRAGAIDRFGYETCRDQTCEIYRAASQF